MFSPKLNWSLAIIILALISTSLRAQTNAGWSEWETLQPEAEEFTVLMPKNSSTETAKFPYHKMELSARLYISSLSNGPVLAVASLSGIKSNPALYSDFQRFNSYVDAFKTWFPSKVRSKEAPVKMTLVGNNIFHGYAGREYKMTIGDLSGSAFAYATKKRFYTIVSLNTKKDDALQEKFLSSFSLPDKPRENVVANTQAAETPLPAQPNAASDDPAATKPQNAATEGNTETPLQPNAQPTPNSPQPNPNPSAKPGETPPGGRPPISGGVLNSKAIYLPLPEVPPGDVVGTVMVQVLVDEQGTVVSARAISGPAQLHQAAVNAARFARFSPTMLMGEPVKVSGTLTYNFVKPVY
jgi:TonB family protein